MTAVTFDHASKSAPSGGHHLERNRLAGLGRRLARRSLMSGSNYGFLVKDSAEDSAGALKNDFQSKENGGGNALQLVITYS